MTQQAPAVPDTIERSIDIDAPVAIELAEAKRVLEQA
jgi:hypothetical protein